MARTVSTLPEWSWTRYLPEVNNDANIPTEYQIIDRYQSIYDGNGYLVVERGDGFWYASSRCRTIGLRHETRYGAMQACGRTAGLGHAVDHTWTISPIRAPR